MNREQVTHLGIGVLVGAVLARLFTLLTRKDEPQIQVLPVPYQLPTEPVVKPKPEPAVETGPVLLTANPVPVVQGRKYRAVLNVGFPLSVFANTESVRKQATDLGFTDVRVFRNRPLDFPGDRVGDWYIEAKWGGGTNSLARPNVAGITLVEVWEG